MSKTRIGILRETKIPPDIRVPLVPRQCRELVERFPDVEIQVQSSPTRCFKDTEYEALGLSVKGKLDECDLLLGVKEVRPETIIQEKTYMFFSHTIKKQPDNQALLQTLAECGNTLIDYELLTDDKGHRLIGFGRWAGLVGGHYALMMWGERTKAYRLRPAWQCKSLEEMYAQYENLDIPPAKFIITGGGRVANGALEVMKAAGIQRVSKEDFLQKEFHKPVLVQLHSLDMYGPKQEGQAVTSEDFYHSPSSFKSIFAPYAAVAEVLINCMYWNPAAPVLFSPEATSSPDFNIKTISDISCDIEGSVPITVRTTSSAMPYYGYDPASGTLTEPFQERTIDIMAIGNLPNELACDAAMDFGNTMSQTILPAYLEDPEAELFQRATILRNGRLTERFEYLRDYLEGR